MQVAVTSPADDAARGGFRVVAELARPTRVEFHNFAVNGDLKTAVAAQCAPGMLLAVLGPAATREQRTASQVMDALRGLQVGRLSVDVVLNGAATTMRTFRKCTGYAPREYFPYEFCTALEAFEFAARLRLPASVPWSQRRTLVDDVLNSLGLGSARMVSHMSPLERRKVVLGVEMCARVRALIMDEPLEGLCARDGVALLAALQAYAAASQTPCIFSITSVPSQTFLGLDRLLVLTGTFQRVFAGRAADLDAALAAAGLVVPARVSPGDFIVDCLAFISDDDLVVGKAGVAAGVDDPGPMAEATEAGVDAPRAGVVEQFALILVRDAKGMVREKTQIVGRFASMLFIALLVDLVFQNQGDQSRSSYSPGSHFASMAMTCMFASVVSLLTTVQIAGADLPVVLRERDCATYAMVPHRLARTLVELPVSFALALMYVVVVKWAVQWSASPGYFVGPLFVLFEAAVGLGYAVSFALSTTASSLVALVMLPQLFFIGLLIPIAGLADWLQWVENVCFVKYAVDLLAIYEFNNTNCHSPYICHSWSAMLNSSDIHAELESEYYLVLLLGFAVGGRFLGTLGLLWREHGVRLRGFRHQD